MTLFLCIIASIIVIDSWRVLLYIRNIRAIIGMEHPPNEFMGFAPDEEFNAIKTNALERDYFSLTYTVISLAIKLCKLTTRFDMCIWDATAKYAGSLASRAALHPALDVFIGGCVGAPFLAVVTIVQSPNLRVGVVLLATMLEVIASTIITGIIAALLVYMVESFGILTSVLPIILINCAGIWLVIYYITVTLPFISRALDSDYYERSIKNLADRVGFPHEKIRVSIADSTVPNALYYSILGWDFILIAKKLLRMLRPSQMLGIVAHELGHWRFRHQRTSHAFTVSKVVGYCFISIVSYGDGTINEAFGFTNQKPHPFIPAYLSIRYIWVVLRDIVKGARNVVMRGCELKADRFASDLGLGLGLRSALLIITRHYKMLPLFDHWYSAWFLGHPTILERSRRLDSWNSGVTFPDETSSTDIRNDKPGEGGSNRGEGMNQSKDTFSAIPQDNESSKKGQAEETNFSEVTHT